MKEIAIIKKVKKKKKKKNKGAGHYVSNSLPLLDTTIARLQKNYKPFFEKTSPKRGRMRYFWHNAQIPERFTGNLTKHETAGCSKQEHSKFL